MAPGIWWSKFSRDGRGINQLTSQKEADMGSGACFYDVAVHVKPVAEGNTSGNSVGHMGEWRSAPVHASE
jgi:hypothetical protein